MTISGLIERLERMKAEHGDLRVTRSTEVGKEDLTDVDIEKISQWEVDLDYLDNPSADEKVVELS